MPETIRQVMVRGRVQGVGYRAWVAQMADELQLDGWVRNRRDGCVEAVFAGPADVVTEIVARCHRGPLSSRVESVVQEQGTSDALNLRRTGERFSVLSTL
jgi:acylphosphatase